MIYVWREVAECMDGSNTLTNMQQDIMMCNLWFSSVLSIVLYIYVKYSGNTNRAFVMSLQNLIPLISSS